nr:polysaccharide biosynthesis C-terminal domain-containing protein [Lacticaseibacillus absianus]
MFAIGNLGSKFITFFMLPLYTARMVPSDYGLVDVISTTAGLLLPVVSLSVFDAVLRFTMDRTVDPAEIFSNSVRITRIGAVIALLTMPLFYLFYRPFTVLPILLVLQAYQSLYTQFAKGIDKISLFAFNGVFLTALTAGLNIIFLWPLNMGFAGYFLSTCLALLISNLMLHFRLHLSKFYQPDRISRDYTHRILAFSTPLIPNSVAWNISNTAGRYAILIFLGSGANGMFAVASKIPSLLSTVTNIFAQSWQLAAIEEFESEGDRKDNFFDTIYRVYIALLFVGASTIMVLVKPLMRILVASTYYSAWQFIPLLLLSVIFSSLSGFLGSQYVAAKRTVEIFKTTIAGSTTSIVLSFLLVKFVGINAVSLASFLSFLLIWIVRHRDIIQTVNSNVTIWSVLIQMGLLLGQYATMFISQVWLAYGLQCLFLIGLLVANRAIVDRLANAGLKVVRRRLKR